MKTLAHLKQPPTWKDCWDLWVMSACGTNWPRTWTFVILALVFLMAMHFWGMLWFPEFVSSSSEFLMVPASLCTGAEMRKKMLAQWAITSLHLSRTCKLWSSKDNNNDCIFGALSIQLFFSWQPTYLATETSEKYQILPITTNTHEHLNHQSPRMIYSDRKGKLLIEQS